MASDQLYHVEKKQVRHIILRSSGFVPESRVAPVLERDVAQVPHLGLAAFDAGQKIWKSRKVSGMRDSALPAQRFQRLGS